MIKSKHIGFFLHILFWFFSLWMLNQNFVFESVEILDVNGVQREVRTRNHQLFYVLGFSLLAKALWVYGNAFWAMPILLKSKQWSAYLSRLLCLLASSLILEMVLVASYAYWVPEAKLSVGYLKSMWQLDALFYLLFYGISVAYTLGKNWWKQERAREHLQREKLQTELNFLKSQINPHFLFNTLNNLFAIAQRDQQADLSEGIAGLARLMRYMLYDSKADRVPVEKEVDFLRSVIALQQLRIAKEDEVVILLDIKGDIRGKQIAPLMLIPFVENAFKHGINWQAQSVIKISFQLVEDVLKFYVTNSKFELPPNVHELSGGIGLENVRRRLELIYPDSYELNIKENEREYQVELQIKLDYL